MRGSNVVINSSNFTSSNSHLDKKQLVRLWLGLLKYTGEIESYLRTLLQKILDSTLPQFDLLSALNHAERPLSKTELTNHIMVSNENVTWLVNRIFNEGLITHLQSIKNNREKLVELTKKGAADFQIFVIEHEIWLIYIVKDLKKDDLTLLVNSLDQLRKVIKCNTSSR